MKPFRDTIPIRTCTLEYNNYRSYKNYLRQDFRKRCGYCNDQDSFCNGSAGYQIDHFIPLSPYKELHTEIETDYSNLVYCCPYCNNAKSNDWPSGDINLNTIGNTGYIDPCDTEYGDHLERYNNGKIHPKTDLGIYMFDKLKLGLRRHQLAWIIEKLRIILDNIIEELDFFEGDTNCFFKDYHELVKQYRYYEKLFENQI